jgi:CheY-like chemotaxis protein
MARETIGRPMEILLVEDSLSDAGLTMHALKHGGVRHRLTLVCSGFEAMQFLRREGGFGRAPQPDLILLDLKLPGMDGHAVLDEIKDDADLKATPVVVLTMSMDEADRLQCERLNVDGYMTKPVDMNQFLGLVKELKRFWQADVLLPTA